MVNTLFKRGFFLWKYIVLESLIMNETFLITKRDEMETLYQNISLSIYQRVLPFPYRQIFEKKIKKNKEIKKLKSRKNVMLLVFSCFSLIISLYKIVNQPLQKHFFCILSIVVFNG